MKNPISSHFKLSGGRGMDHGSDDEEEEGEKEKRSLAESHGAD